VIPRFSSDGSVRAITSLVSVYLFSPSWWSIRIGESAMVSSNLTVVGNQGEIETSQARGTSGVPTVQIGNPEDCEFPVHSDLLSYT